MQLSRFTFAILATLIHVGVVDRILADDGPKITSLYPVGGSIGTSVDVQAGGTFPNWPASVWSEQPGLKWTALEKPGQFRVEISSDAKPGPCRVRFFDSKGASASRSWFIGWSPETTEVEPNDGYKQAQKLEPSPIVVHAVLGKAGDYDTFSIPCQQGQTIVASVMANRWIGSPVDTSLQILNDRGTVLAQNLDSDGLDPFLAWQVPQTGNYLLRVFGFPETPDGTISVAGNESFVYRLAVTTGPYLRSTRPLTLEANGPTHLKLLGLNFPGDSLPAIDLDPRTNTIRSLESDTPQIVFLKEALGFQRLPLVQHACHVEAIDRDESKTEQTVFQPPLTITGGLSNPGEVDRYRIQVPENSRWKIMIESRSIGFLSDSVLRLLDEAGKEIQRVDDVQDSVDPHVSWHSKAAGIAVIEVSDLFGKGGEGYDYRLTVAEEKPTALISIPNEVIQGIAGKPIEIPIQIERLLDFPADVTFELRGAGEGMTTEMAISQMGKESAKEVKWIIQSTAPHQGPIQIVARSDAFPGGISFAKAKDSRSSSLWLSIASP